MSRGNDLSTPHEEWGFPGLKPGDQWCLCALRWKEVYDAGSAPPVVLESTHVSALEHLDLAAEPEHRFRFVQVINRDDSDVLKQ